MPDAFADEVRFALTHAASSETISTLLDRACRHSSPECSRTRLLLLLVNVCLETGRSKQALRWLDAIDSEVAPTDLLPALRSALATGHLQLVLDLAHRLVSESEASPQERLQVAKDAVMLAKKLRLPYGRNGVWQSHMKLLSLASDLLGDGLIFYSDEGLAQPAQQLVKEIEQMRNCRPQPKSIVKSANQEAVS